MLTLCIMKSSPEIGDISSPLRKVSSISYYKKFNMVAKANPIRKKGISSAVLHDLSLVNVQFDEIKEKDCLRF